MRIAIVGAGMAGLACAARLGAAGHGVMLFDKGRGAGGRMATRRIATALGEASFDHGAQYFTVRDPGFAAQVGVWRQAGLVAPWAAAGPEAWVGTPAMNAPVRALAEGAAVRWSARVDALAGGPGAWRVVGDGIDEAGFDATLVAVPAEQAARLLAPWDAAMAARAHATPSLPCWTVMAAFASAVDSASDCRREQGIVGWAARNSAKPGRVGPESWVIQAAPDWSVTHLEDRPETVLAALLRAFADTIGRPLPQALSTSVHRWRFARSGAGGQGCLWNAAMRLGVCGDWLLGPRVECAWLSGDGLADAVVAEEAGRA